MSKKTVLSALVGLATLCMGVNAAELNAYTVMPEKYASRIFAEFTKDTGIKVNFLRFSTGEALARLTAEKGNPQVDALLGGPADMYAAAKKEGILEAYRPADSDAIAPEMRDPENYWTGVGVIPLCFLTNTKFLKKNNMEAPTKWADLLDPRYKRNLQMADARTSGTATERIFSLVKIMGEDIAVGAKIYNLTGFSAHADRDQMLAFYKGMERKPKAFFVVHGEYDAASSFAHLLNTELGTATYIPNFGDAAIIDGTDWRIEETKVITSAPAIQAMRDYLRNFEKDYLVYKGRMEQLITHDPRRIPDIRAKMDKIRKYIDDVMKTL